jgi:hypothetical protein
MKFGPLFLLLFVTLTLFAGCTALFGPKPVIVQQSGSQSLSLSQGIIYNVQALVRNDGADGDVIVTATLIDAGKNFVRDEVSTRVYIPSGQTKKVVLTLDGEFGRTYQYTVKARG